jgi:hypothetical protein
MSQHYEQHFSRRSKGSAVARNSPIAPHRLFPVCGRGVKESITALSYLNRINASLE